MFCRVGVCVPSTSTGMEVSRNLPKFRVRVYVYGVLRYGHECTELHLCCIAHQKEKPILGTNPRLEAPLRLWFSCTFRNSAIIPATPSIEKRTTRRWILECSRYIVAKRQQFSCPLAMDSSMLSLQCGKATAVFVPFGDREIAAVVWKCGSRDWIWFSPCSMIYVSRVIILLLYEHVRVRVVVILFCFFRVSAARNEDMLYTIYIYDMQRSWCRFGGHYVLRPTAGAVVSIRKSTSLQNAPWLCASIQEESWAISSWSSTVTSAVNID